MRSLDVGVFGARAIPSTYSGYETFLTSLLPALADRGHSVTMYCRRGTFEGSGPYAGVQRQTLPAIPGKQLNTLSHGLLSSIRCRLAHHEVVLAVNVANAAFCAFNRFSGQPILLNTDGQEWLRGKWGSAARWFFHTSARFARRSATGLISDCASMAAVYSTEFGAGSTVIPYCHPPIQASDATHALQRLGLEKDRYFVIAGRLNPENNVDRVAEEFSRSDLPIPLLVLGVANYRSPVAERLRRLSASDERVRVVGHVDDRAEFLGLLSSARGYIHAHSVGGMNPSLVEAMHVGAHIVALETTFNRETLGDAGIYLDLDVPGNLADILKHVYALCPEEATAARSGARARAAERYGLTEVVDAYERLLLAAADGPARRSVVLPTRWAHAG